MYQEFLPQGPGLGETGLIACHLNNIGTVPPSCNLSAHSILDDKIPPQKPRSDTSLCSEFGEKRTLPPTIVSAGVKVT